MIYFVSVLPVIVACFFVGLYLFRFYKKKVNSLAIEEKCITLDKTLKTILIVLSAIFIVSYFYRLFTVDYFLDINIRNGSPFLSRGEIIWMNILRLFTYGMVVVYLVVPFFKIRTLNNLVSYVGIVVCILNLVFFKQNLICFQGGNYSIFSDRAIEFAVELALGLSISGLYLTHKIVTKDFLKFKSKDFLFSFLYGAGIFLGLCFFMMDPNAIPCFFSSELVGEAEGFNLVHRIALYFVTAIGIGLFFLLRHKNPFIKYATMLMLSICGINSFFIVYTWKIPLTSLPLHLCNAALIVGLFAFIFKSKKLFYFTYFVNVLGAICALLLPNTSGSLLTSGNIRFWMTHITVILVPVLAVALNVFPRPNFKMMLNSIMVFTIYFVVAAFSNMLISNVDPSVDYFFLNSDFFVTKFSFAYNLRFGHIYTWQWGKYLFKSYPLYWLAIYLVYIVAMFLIWLVYSYIYKVRDNYAKLRELEIQDKVDILNFKKDLKQRGLKMNMENSIEKDKVVIKNFTKYYGSSDTPAVKDFSLTINKGEVFGFLGHNGAGKSTLIKSMVGIQSISSGSISICGFDITNQPMQAKLQMGYVSDNHAVYEKLTGREYINFVADLYLVSKKDRDERIEKYAKLFELTNALDRAIKGYSHGMKQKLVVIASIIHDPKVWILDEPLTGLDPMSSHQIKLLMREKANAGCIVFFSSHVIEVVEKICDKFAIISHGILKGVYTADQLKNKEVNLEDLYIDVALENKNVVQEETLEEKDENKTGKKSSFVKKVKSLFKAKKNNKR